MAAKAEVRWFKAHAKLVAADASAACQALERESGKRAKVARSKAVCAPPFQSYQFGATLTLEALAIFVKQRRALSQIDPGQLENPNWETMLDTGAFGPILTISEK